MASLFRAGTVWRTRGPYLRPDLLVCIFSRTSQGARHRSRPLHKRVIYIGETCGQNLRQRWKQFASSAFSNNGGHSGGNTYFKLFPQTYQSKVAVAFATPRYKDPLLTYRIRYLERKWLFEYVRAYGKPPC